jgi:lipopolysaccharide/colanic/teichoic acid biosynthesis glycosyltransferase
MPSRPHPTRYYDLSKRVLDIIVSLAGLLLTAPLQALLALLVARKLGLPILFRQERPGFHGKPFILIKFRTMRPPDINAGLLSDADRLTRFGHRLRSTSLDELPSLWNVLRGEMSLVGPRPLLMKYLERYTPDQARRHDVRPGITGLAQVSGRNALAWEDRLAVDVSYVDRRSLGLDLEILKKTVLLVLRRTGVSATSADPTMPEFLGSARSGRST